jgi:DNA primase
MSLYSLGIEGNIIAPSSENARINLVKDWVDLHKEKYTIFDNDPAGIKAMQNYEEMYNIPYLLIPLSKDISDSVKDHGAKTVKTVIKSMLTK